MKAVFSAIKNFVRDEQGVTMVEYGLIAALISVVCIIALTGVGGNLNETYKMICNKLAGAVTSGGGAAAACV
jgi:pilus assembly protein Flp/PilA